MSPQTDPRIAELLDLAAAVGLPLAVRPETVCALEDAGWLIDPFTAQMWRDPAAPPAHLFELAGDIEEALEVQL